MQRPLVTVPAPFIRLLCRALLVVSLASTAFAAESSSVTISEVRLGIAGAYRVGHWTCLQLDIQAAAPLTDVQLKVTLPDGEGVRTETVTTVALSSGAQTVETYVKLGRVSSDLGVELQSSDGVRLAATQISPPDLPTAKLGSQRIALTLGNDIGVSAALDQRRQRLDQETVHAHVADPQVLPRNWLGYQGIELVVLSGSEEFLSRLKTEQISALVEWVTMGGRILLALGQSAETLAGEDGPLAPLLPGSLDGIRLQRQTANIEGFAGNTAKSLDSFVAPGELSFRLPMANLTDPRGTIELFEGIGRERTPVVVRASTGFGHVLFVALDLDRPPLTQWQDGRRKVLNKLLTLALEPVEREDADQKVAKLTQIGFDDLAGQLRVGLDQFPQVLLVPFSWIGVLIVIYLILIGPLDYFVLRSWRQKFGLTWFTFPALVLVACGVAFWLTQHWKGHTTRVNQIDVVDIDMETGRMRQHTWSHLFSPSSRKYDIHIQPATTIVELVDANQSALTSWQGLPGKSFGGMNTSRLHHSVDPYTILADFSGADSQAEIRGIPIDLYSSRSFAGLRWGQVELAEPPRLEADVDQQLSGRVRNPLPVSLRDCKLCFGRWVVSLPSLAPGAEAEVDRFSKIKTIDGMLTQTKVDQDFKDYSQPWDRKGVDIPRIMQMMMFHKAAGGTQYTSLLNRFQSRLDFSDHLTSGKAILMGTTDEAASTLLPDEPADVAQQNHTYYRILLPVQRSGSPAATTSTQPGTAGLASRELPRD